MYAIAASFDISGFTAFCRRPDANRYLPLYLDNVFKEFKAAFDGGFWQSLQDKDGFEFVPWPAYRKYTGDGAVMLWLREDEDGFRNELSTSVVGTLRFFQKELPAKVSLWEEEWRIPELPKRVRCGISRGPVYRVDFEDSRGRSFDYVGHTINLAIRLQDHCPSVGFIVHRSLAPNLPGLLQAKTKNMKGCSDESVYLFQDDFDDAANDPGSNKMDEMFSDIGNGGG